MNHEDKLVFSDEIKDLLSHIDLFNESWQVLTDIAPEQLKSLRHVATIESIGSSTRIEGVKLTDAEIEKLLSGLTSESFKSRDEEEVSGYAFVMEEVFVSYEYIPLTENYIKQLHAMLLKYSTKDIRHRGEYKKFSNNVEAFGSQGQSLGIVFETSSPFNTIQEMHELVVWASNSLEEGAVHPLIIIGKFIVLFLAIHPFQDGNGRLSRILTTLLLLKSGYFYVPYSSLETIIEATKDGYYRALRLTQATLKKEKQDFNPWLIYFLRSLKKQIERLEYTLQKEKIMLASLPKLAAQILSLVEERGRITVSEIVNSTNAPLSTVKKYVSMLVTKKYLNRHGKGRAIWYTKGH